MHGSKWRGSCPTPSTSCSMSWDEKCMSGRHIASFRSRLGVSEISRRTVYVYGLDGMDGSSLRGMCLSARRAIAVLGVSLFVRDRDVLVHAYTQ